MSDRRKAARFVFTKPAAARLHVLHDVVIERSDPEHLTVLAAGSSAPGEELAMRICAEDGQVVTLMVRTLDSRPVVMDAVGVRYRLSLQVIASVPDVDAALEAH